MSERVRAFSNGSQYSDWTDRNCAECDRYREDVAATCPLDRALLLAYGGDGTISVAKARRLGCFTNELQYPAASCPEFVERRRIMDAGDTTQ